MENLENSLLALQRIVASALPVGHKGTSTNGRTFYSRPFIVTQSSYKDAGEALKRYIAKVTVLGDKRPYTIEIVVDKEERVLEGEEFVYSVTGHDERLAKELAILIRERLTKRRDDRSIIDDFRAF